MRQMNLHLMSTSSNLPVKTYMIFEQKQIPASPAFRHRRSIAIRLTAWMKQKTGCAQFMQARDLSKCRSKFSLQKNKRAIIFASLKEEAAKSSKKKGSVAGAVALIIGTSIGSGILALPKKASPAGLLPSSISMVGCWIFLLVEALLLVEINADLMKRKKTRVEEDGIEIISITTMAQETLGELGATLTTVAYVFLGYTSMVAYTSKSAQILYHLTNLPESVSGFLFTVLFTLLISVGGPKATDHVNRWLTASMIGMLIAIEVLGIAFGGWSGLEGREEWARVPATIPVIIFSLVYHDLAPVLCAYLGGDLRRLRLSILLGSVVPLVALLIWDAIALGLSSSVDQSADPVELLTRVSWSGVSSMVEAFSLLAVGTSLLGTLLSFSEFFKEQLKNLSSGSARGQVLEKSNTLIDQQKWWGRNGTSFAAAAMVVGPSFLVSVTIPDAFSAATDIAGGYCMTVLYGVLPPAMAWAMYTEEGEDSKGRAVSTSRPALVCMGLLACGIVVEQILRDISCLSS